MKPTHILLRNRDTRRPVTWSTLPMKAELEQAIRAFASPESCEVKTVTIDGSRESLAAAFRDNEGWRSSR